MSSLPAGDKRAVVLLSGGIDSATVLWLAKSRGYVLFAMTFDYGQRHRMEIESAAKIAKSAEVQEHLVFSLGMHLIGGSVLTGTGEVPKDRLDGVGGGEIPVTYVPARNTVFLSIALSWAEVLGAGYVFIGAHAVDYSGYPDCRPEYIQAFQSMADLATRRGVEGDPIKIEAPLIDMNKSEIIKLGAVLGADFSITTSCYDPDDSGKACGRCDSCLIRKRAFGHSGIEDPTVYLEQ
ncbi:MAG: 7-cyano-7-deazaguanine synthase QueC [Actinobacteria bacterium]|nr:7-cyano-7-deazaguanine synthase QueC [Actinomycetota bacterium]